MATGFPTKANWAAGDVLTASAMDDLAGTVNLMSNASASQGSALLSNASGTSFAYNPLSAAGKNGVINGGMDIAQRGTSINTASATFAYTLDRLWVYSNGPAVTTSQQVTGDTTNLPNIQYCARLQRQSGQTSSASTVWNFAIETKDSIRFAGQTVTISFYARKSSTLTSGSSLAGTLYSGTGTDQNGLGGFTGQATVASTYPTITTTWARYTATGTVSASATELRIEFGVTWGSGTAGANDYVEVTGVQMETGSIPTAFSRAGGNIQGELAACQRYYYRVYTVVQAYLFAFSYNSSSIQFNYRLPVTMRTSPTTLDTLNINIQDISIGTTYTGSTISINSSTPDSVFCVQGGYGGALTTYRPYNVIGNGTLGYLGFGAEL